MRILKMAVLASVLAAPMPALGQDLVSVGQVGVWDILVDPTSETTLFDIGAIRHELLQLLGVRVDVLTPKALPESLRAKVLAEARPV